MSDPSITPPPTYGSVPTPVTGHEPVAPGAVPSTTPIPVAPSTGHPGSSDSGAGAAASAAKQAASTVKDEVTSVASDAAASAGDVLGTARDEAAKVASEAKDQVSTLLHEATGQLRSQSTAGKERATVGLRGVSGELASLADASEDQGMVSDLARQASQRLDGAAGWLEDRDLDGVLTDVQRFARRRPFAFLAIAVGAGVVVGRLTRALKDAPSGTTSAHRTHDDDGASLDEASVTRLDHGRPPHR
ncbi:hypothetical protein C8046_13785 [Serinibacter arcticus]|uniref:Uncharacterized protein n=1 Tax=Serinibacter arcticus TaxID=1655435 RepID=A0A2U1ZX35_9MICO|nr:hypothetical protein [Serinibacter arcticus]PWD51556.1 hypothetical protein C8046_13785 [Serinibacter arcticus]